MIRLTRLSHVPFVVNSDLIEHIEITPDTVICLTTGQMIRVLETAEEIVERIVAFRKAIQNGGAASETGPGHPEESGEERENATGEPVAGAIRAADDVEEQ